MVDLTKSLDLARDLGCEYADIRLVTAEEEHIRVTDTKVTLCNRKMTRGLNVRVLADGRWGFASTDTIDESNMLQAVSAASRLAEMSQLKREVNLSEEDAVTAEFETPVDIDPFGVPARDRASLLREANLVALAVGGVQGASSHAEFHRESIDFASSEGSRISQVIHWGGGGMCAVAEGAGTVLQRCYPYRGQAGQGQNYQTGGYEILMQMALKANARRVGEEAVGLLTAPSCSSGATDVILDPSMMAMQVHESVGHAVEMDRVLGDDEANFGRSFISLEDLGSYRYGSELVNITADATTLGGAGSYGYDDEGIPAQRTPLVVSGVLENLLMSRETAGAAGVKSNGSARALPPCSIPLIRMSNINLEPGASSLEDMIATTDDGIFMDGFRCYDIDDRRMNFMFSSEVGWKIRNGRIIGMIRNPSYTSTTPAFWRSCDAVGGETDWQLMGLPNCGKGQPWQFTRVGHGVPPARFRNIEVGM